MADDLEAAQARNIGEQRDQIERLRAKAYALVSANPTGPLADKARAFLARAPKTVVGGTAERMASMRPAPVKVGQLTGGDFGGLETLPPTPDEELGFRNDLAEPGIGTQAITTLSDPHKRREFERGVSDMVTFGAAEKLAKLAEKHGLTSTPGEGGFTPEGSALDAERAPGYRGGGQVLGSFLPGGARLLGSAAGGAAGTLVRPIAARGVGGSIIAGGLAGAAANTGTMVGISGARTAVEGKREGESFKDYLARIRDSAGGEINPINAAAGAVFGAGTGASAGIGNSRGQTGRDIRLVEQYGAKPNPFGGAHGGIFESPALRDVEGSTREAGALARTNARKVLSGLGEEQTGLSREYGAAKKAAADQGFLEARIDPLNVQEEAQRLMRGERVTGAQRAAIQSEVVDALERHPQGMTLDDFNDFRAKLGDIFGTSPGEASHPAIDRLRQAAKRTVDETEMGPINERYHQGTKALDKKYEQLKLTRETTPRVAEERLAGEILRRGENTPTAGIQEPAIEEFLQANPRYRPLFDSISLLNAKDRMALGLEGHGGSLYTRMHGALHHNIEPLQVGAYRLLSPAERLSVPASVAAQYFLNGGNQ